MLASEKARLDISQLVFALSKDSEVVDSEASPIGSRTSKSGRVVEIGFIGRHPAGSHQAEALVRRIRGQYADFRPPNTQMHLAGAAALGVDFVHITYHGFLWIILAIVCIGFILLTYAFRSLLLPIKAVILNCASVAASIGIVVLAVQTGIDSHLGLRHTSQIEAWVPAFLFAVLFGLSMDYHIFIVARIREEWHRCGSTEEAVANGLKHTRGVVRAAAAVMVVTFAGFMTSSFADVQKLGIGLSFGIVLDVLLVRSLLVPSAMRAAGRWNWYFPKLRRDRQASIAVNQAMGETSD
jgi:RND superfamily putative drug exporter